MKQHLSQKYVALTSSMVRARHGNQRFAESCFQELAAPGGNIDEHGWKAFCLADILHGCCKILAAALPIAHGTWLRKAGSCKHVGMLRGA